jgi:hypothetical protein
MYRGVQTGPSQSPWGASEYQTIKSNGGTIIEYNGFSYANFLPSAITDKSQVSSSVFATWDTYAAWAETYGIHVIFTFGNLCSAGFAPAWMKALVGGDAKLLEYDYFTGNSAVSTVTTSIRCFWQAAATRYASNPYVIFDFFNEPMNGNLQNVGGYVTPSNYRTVEQGYVNVITDLVDAVRTINSNQLILVDFSWASWYDRDYSTIPIDVPRNIIWEFHAYVSNTGGYTLSAWEHSFIDMAVGWFVTDLGKPLYIGEYGFIDSSTYLEAPSFPDWQSILSSEVAYLKTKSLWGYSWWDYGFLYRYSAATFSASDSTWILNTVLHP